MGLQRFAAQQEKAVRGQKIPLEAAPEEVKKARFSPRLIKSLRKHLGVTQKEMATLAGVTVGAIFQWEKGIFEPRAKRRRSWWPFGSLDDVRQGRYWKKKVLRRHRREIQGPKGKQGGELLKDNTFRFPSIHFWSADANRLLEE